jgi:ABC-type molybdate transport system permease subunit
MYDQHTQMEAILLLQYINTSQISTFILGMISTYSTYSMTGNHMKCKYLLNVFHQLPVLRQVKVSNKRNFDWVPMHL